MWILKSVLLGWWLFGFGTLGFLRFTCFRKLPPNCAVSANLITRRTSQNPVWWTALAVSLALGYAAVRSWSAPLILWVAVFVTGLVPAGFFASFIALLVKSKHVSHSHSNESVR